MDNEIASEFEDLSICGEERSGLAKYFGVSSETKLVHCYVRDCKQTFRNWKIFNLKRHLKSAFPIQFM